MDRFLLNYLPNLKKSIIELNYGDKLSLILILNYVQFNNVMDSLILKHFLYNAVCVEDIFVNNV